MDFSSIQLTRSIDVAGGDGSLQIQATVWGAGVTSVSVDVADPTGSSWRAVGLHQENEGSWVESIAVPTTTLSGVYRVTGIEITDSSGKTAVVSGDQLRQEGFDAEFSVYRGPDIEAPHLEGFTVSPQTTEASAGPVDVALDAEVGDSQSGVKEIWIGVKIPGHLPPYDLTSWYGGRLLSGTQGSGEHVVEFHLPRWAYPGTYAIAAVELEDFAGNVVKVETPELEAQGLPTQFEATGPGDTTPPEILGVSLDRSTIPATGGTVLTFVHVRDDLSGFAEFPDNDFSDVWVGFEWPPHVGGTETTGVVPQLVSGDAHDGTWKLTTTFGADALPGQYTIDYLSASDLASNATLLGEDELESRGWALTFTKLPSGD